MVLLEKLLKSRQRNVKCQRIIFLDDTGKSFWLELMCRLPNFAKIPYISKSNLAIMSICSHFYFGFLLLRVNVDGIDLMRKQELIDDVEASVLFSGLLTQRKVHIAIICTLLDFQFLPLYWSLYAVKGLNSTRICDFDY
ncbi:hypothetical protein Hanom_Chr15g01400511 [Helianthus anomalus]